MLFQQFINTLVQLSIVLLVALIIWFVFGRKRDTFARWIGLIWPSRHGVKLALLIILVWFFIKMGLFLIPEFTAGSTADNTVAGSIRANGFNLETVIVILLMAGIKTALAEEILFRGLIGKRLVNGLGFTSGNLLQAIIFAAVHLLVFIVPGGPEPTLLLVSLMVSVPFIGGWLMGYANHRDGRGSILPGWMIHAVGNAVSYPVLAFLI